MRICSFLPSATEIVYALGLGNALVGVSHECDYPHEARAKPRVVRSRFDPAAHTSREIDSLVAGMSARGERIYEVDQEALRLARPDLVITQQLCDVCAISYDDVQRAVARLEDPPQVVSLDPRGLEDVLEDIERVAGATGTTSRAEELVAALRWRIEAVRSRGSAAAQRPRVACIEWLDPPIVAGHWVPEMVHLAGGSDGLAQPGAASRRLQMDELVGYQPEVLVLMPCGMDLGRAVREVSFLPDRRRWEGLPAFRQGRVCAVDAGSLFSRSGPRLVEGLEILARIVHPEVFGDALPVDSARRLEALPV